jgi:hypothetical protein
MIHRNLTLKILIGKKKYHYSHVILTMLNHVIPKIGHSHVHSHTKH